MAFSYDFTPLTASFLLASNWRCSSPRQSDGCAQLWHTGATTPGHGQTDGRRSEAREYRRVGDEPWTSSAPVHWGVTRADRIADYG